MCHMAITGQHMYINSCEPQTKTSGLSGRPPHGHRWKCATLRPSWSSQLADVGDMNRGKTFLFSATELVVCLLKNGCLAVQPPTSSPTRQMWDYQGAEIAEGAGLSHWKRHVRNWGAQTWNRMTMWWTPQVRQTSHQVIISQVPLAGSCGCILNSEG